MQSRRPDESVAPGFQPYPEAGRACGVGRRSSKSSRTNPPAASRQCLYETGKACLISGARREPRRALGVEQHAAESLLYLFRSRAPAFASPRAIEPERFASGVHRDVR